MKRLSAKPRLKLWPYPHTVLGIYEHGQRVGQVTITTRQPGPTHRCVMPDGRELIISRAPTLDALVAILRRFL